MCRATGARGIRQCTCFRMERMRSLVVCILSRIVCFKNRCTRWSWGDSVLLSSLPLPRLFHNSSGRLSPPDRERRGAGEPGNSGRSWLAGAVIRKQMRPQSLCSAPKGRLGTIHRSLQCCQTVPPREFLALLTCFTLSEKKIWCCIIAWQFQTVWWWFSGTFFSDCVCVCAKVLCSSVYVKQYKQYWTWTLYKSS